MARLLLIRHGRTRLHKDDRFWGQTDIPLSQVGIKQAGRLRARLVGEKIDAVYSSTLSRTRATAEIVAAGRKLEVQAARELCECNFGYIEGLTYPEIEKQYPVLAKELMARTAVNFPGGESLAAMDRRVKTFLTNLQKHDDDETIAVVSHGGPIRLIICNLLGLPPKHWQQLRIDLASLSIVDTYQALAILSLLNDTSHLEDKEP